MPSVLVGIAPRMQPYDDSMESLRSAMQYACNAGFTVRLAKARGGFPGFQNYGPVMAQMVESRDTHFFIAGDDVLYPEDCIVRLVNAGKDVISGIYRMNWLKEVQPANHGDGTAETFLKRLREGVVYPAKFVSAHSMTIRREVIEKMMVDYPELAYEQFGKTMYALFLPMVYEGAIYQDDWAFSIRARQSGFGLWDDFGCRLKHFCGDFLGFEDVESA